MNTNQGSQNNRSTDWTHTIQYADTLSPHEMALRDLFVKEYMFDYNWTHAAMRCGFNGTLAQEYGSRFSQDPYVLWRIEQAELQIAKQTPEDAKDAEAFERQRVIESLKREANYKGPGASAAARVSALKALASIHGLDAPKRTKIDLNGTRAVMIVPAVASVEDWETIAKESQEQLVRDTDADA